MFCSVLDRTYFHFVATCCLQYCLLCWWEAVAIKSILVALSQCLSYTSPSIFSLQNMGGSLYFAILSLVNFTFLIHSTRSYLHKLHIYNTHHCAGYFYASRVITNNFSSLLQIFWIGKAIMWTELFWLHVIYPVFTMLLLSFMMPFLFWIFLCPLLLKCRCLFLNNKMQLSYSFVKKATKIMFF